MNSEPKKQKNKNKKNKNKKTKKNKKQKKVEIPSMFCFKLCVFWVLVLYISP